MSKLISVIIPCYNSAHTLERVFKSLLSQSYTRWEAIFVNDGSIDQTEETIKKFILYNPDKIIHYYYQYNRGVSSARNYGMEKAKGEYIAFLDSDDFWHADKLNLQLEFMQKNGFEISGSLHQIIKPDDAMQIIKSRLPLSLRYKIIRWPGILFKTPFCTPSVMMSAGLKHFLFDEKLSSAEDYDLWKRISFKHNMVKIMHPLAYTCKHNYLASDCLSSRIFETQKNILISDIKILQSAVYPLKSKIVAVLAILFGLLKFMNRYFFWILFKFLGIRKTRAKNL